MSELLQGASDKCKISGCQLAAKDREIAALREDIARLRRELWDSCNTDPAEAMRDGAIYAAVSRAKDPEAYDKMLDEVTADARAELAAEALRAKCEAIARQRAATIYCSDWDGGYEAKSAYLEMADDIAALKGNGEGK
jgi:hypothetical protein